MARQDLGVPEAQLTGAFRPGLGALPDIANPHHPMLGERGPEWSGGIGMAPELLAL